MTAPTVLPSPQPGLSSCFPTWLRHTCGVTLASHPFLGALPTQHMWSPVTKSPLGQAALLGICHQLMDIFSSNTRGSGLPDIPTPSPLLHYTPTRDGAEVSKNSQYSSKTQANKCIKLCTSTLNTSILEEWAPVGVYIAQKLNLFAESLEIQSVFQMTR